jgi:hypothetical protein
MRAPFIRTFLLAAPAFLACYIAPPPPNPFVVPKQLFFDSVETILVTSATVVGEIPVADSTLAYLETLIETRLREAGLSVVPASEYAAIWQRISDETGGLYDPYTGERDEEKFQAAVDSMNAELDARFDFDALLYPEVWEVMAPFEGGLARWGGVTRLIPSARGYSGEVRAATLYLVIQDKTGNELYAHEAGIQVLEHMERGQLTAIEPERLFEDTTWTVAAVLQALDPIIQARSTVTPPP